MVRATLIRLGIPWNAKATQLARDRFEVNLDGQVEVHFGSIGGRWRIPQRIILYLELQPQTRGPGMDVVRGRSIVVSAYSLWSGFSANTTRDDTQGPRNDERGGGVGEELTDWVDKEKDHSSDASI